MKWTKAQNDAIKTRNKNILVSASAGSGKTAVLSERVLSLLKEGYDIDKFLIFTFTKASAKEMKARIYKKIVSEYRLTKSAHLKTQLEKINNASISTIHSFCMSVVKESFYSLDMPPRFSICGDVDEALINSEVMHTILEENYEKKTDEFILVANFFEEKIETVVMSLARMLVQKIDVDKFVDGIKDFYTNDALVEKILDDYVLKEKNEVILIIKNLILKVAGNKKATQTLEDDLRLIDECSGFDVNFSTFKSDRNLSENDRAIKDEILETRKKYKDRINSLKLLDIHFELEAHKNNLVIVEELCRLATDFIKRSFKARVENNLISFNDLEMLAKQALEDDRIAEVYKRRYDFVFVDEYQDTSDIQEYIISKVTRDNNAFMVGDIKQSIYSFRQANPEIFIDKYHRFATDDLSERIDLNSNFRSSKHVLDFVNEVFDVLMTREHGGLDYKKEARLEFGNKTLSHFDSEPKFVFVKRKEDSAIRRQYEYIASEVKSLIESGKKYSDIVVLSRSLASSVMEASDVFRSNDIPFYFDYSESYLDSLEVDIMLNYLRLIDNFRNDLAFLSIIRLPRYHFTDNEIYKIRRENTNGSIYDTFISYNHDKDIKEKIDCFLSEIKRFRRLEYQVSLDELVQYIYKETDFEKYVYLLDKPKQRLANIRLLFSIANEYESSTMVGLANFLKFIEGIKKNKKDFSGANIISDKDNVLRIMSIHKSKGLEFDTVFLVHSDKKFNELDFRGSYVFKDNYIELDYIDSKRRIKKKSFIKKIILNALKKKMHEEELRLLYVALTRAINKLYIVSSIKEEEDIRRYELRSSNSFFQYMSPIFMGKTIDIIDEIDHKTSIKEFDYEVKERDVKTIDFENMNKFTKKSVTSIVHGKEGLTIKEGAVNEEAMRLGSQFHKIMQWIDFDSDVEHEFDRLIDIGVIRDKESIDLVKTLFRSKMYKIIKDSVKIERELEFIYRDNEFIQGIIDLVVHTKDGVIIADYKTDKSLKNVEDYRKQLDYYATAYEKVRKEKVIRKYLYFVKLDELYTID